MPKVVRMIRALPLFLTLSFVSSCKTNHDPAEPWRIGTDVPDQPLIVVDPLDLIETDSLVVTGITNFYGTLVPESGSGAGWIIDPDTCGLARVDLQTGARIGGVGRCGAGPGEFKQPTTFSLLGDSAALIWDPGLFRLVRIPLRGTADTVTWTDRVVLEEGGPPDITQIASAGDGQVILAYSLRQGSQEPLDAWFDAETGAIVARRFPAPKESWATSRQVGSPTDSHSFCEAPFGLIMASRWGHEFLAISHAGTPLWAIFDQAATPPRTVDRTPGTSGAQVQMGVWNRIPVCGDAVALLRTGRLHSPLRDIVFDLGGTIQLWDYEGRLRLDVDAEPGGEGEPLMGLGFWWDGAFWLQDRGTDIPTLRKFEVRRGSGRIVRLP